MTYVKPELYGHSAIAVIQSGDQNKVIEVDEAGPLPTEPAYQADE